MNEKMTSSHIAMASPALPALLAFLFLAAPGASASDEHVDGDGRFLLLDCGGPGAASSTNGSSAHLAHLLAALPSVAAPEGSAVLSNGSAFVRGVCIGNNSSPEDCHACLAAAARNITGGCGGPTGRRGGAWSDGCFLAYYADANASDVRDDRRNVLCEGDVPRSYLDDGDSRGQLLANYYYNWMIPDLSFAWLALDLAPRAADEPARMLAAGEKTSLYDPGMTVRAVAQCTGDRAAPADCLRCLKGSAWQAALSCGAAGAGWLSGGRVLSYGCYLRFEVSYRCGDAWQRANGEARGRRGECSSASAPASGGAFLRWLAGALVAAVLLLHGPRGI